MQDLFHGNTLWKYQKNVLLEKKMLPASSDLFRNLLPSGNSP